MLGPRGRTVVALGVLSWAGKLTALCLMSSNVRSNVLFHLPFACNIIMLVVLLFVDPYILTNSLVACW